MASHSVVVDTATSSLLLHVGIHKAELDQIITNRAIRPCNVMQERGKRSWVVLHTTSEAALDRALRWGFDELGKQQDKSQLALISFDFTELGVGHFMITNNLTTTDWKHFRFHGDLPLRCANIKGELLVQACDEVQDVI